VKPLRILYILLSIIILASLSLVYTKTDEVVKTAERIVTTIAPKPTTILDTGLPDYHLINTAFIEQAPEKDWSLPWQDACEEAALLTVKYYYDNKEPDSVEQKNAILSMIDFENTYQYPIDVNLDQMALIASEYLNLTPIIIDNPTIDQIIKYISQDIPVIIPANGKTLYQENRNFKNGGPWYHNLTILGYDSSKLQFIVHDVGTRHGAYFRYSYSLLMKAIHDLPSSGIISEIDTGTPRALVLIK